MPTGIGYSGDAVGLNQLSRNTGVLQVQQQQLVTGKRIPFAAIDPAALGVFVELDTGAASTRAGVRNANDGLSVLQTAEGTASSITDSLQRMRELAVQSASGTLNNDQRAAIDAEFQQLSDEVGRQARGTEFNGLSLTDGSAGNVDVQVGPDNAGSSRVGVGFGDLTDTGLGIDGLDVLSQGGAQGALDALDSALDTVNQQRTDIGASYNRLESSIRYGESSATEQDAAAARIMDADFATLVSENAGSQIQQQAGVAALAQSRNIQRTAVLGLLG